MYKYKNKKESSFCPMGEFNNGFVECYWFGTVSLSDCRECSVRKDKELITKSDGLL